jgi:signal transduction histidine kinase
MEPGKASETILHETDRLAELVNDLLYISKLENITTVYTPTKVDIASLLRSCAERQRVFADRNGVIIGFDFAEEPIYIDCVEELLFRALDNLISNGVRYAASEIMLTCRSERHKLIIEVSDDGKGIADDIMPYIFERFHKGPDGNHGIGLAIAKSIVKQHKGTIAAANSPEGGAIFTIEMPMGTPVN